MDSLIIMWAFIVLLPIIITTALCIHCRAAAPTRIPQSIDDYEYKPHDMMSPASHSSFTVLRPSNYGQQRGDTGLRMDRMDAFLSVSSLPAPESWKNSFAKPAVDNDSVPSYENDEADVDYSNKDSIPEYLDVLPDNVDPSVSQSAHNDDRKSASLSSVVTEDYQNVPEQERDSLGDNLEYENVPEKKEPAHASVNYDDTSESEDDDNPDYENVEKKIPRLR
ncbi:uncharacterized protein [Ambystoma mexicanum]|uniref:uncharacterized protein n=1 Tax=Ambystoma mexicanum TaxID=8296 RepID=UPI0037E71C22